MASKEKQHQSYRYVTLHYFPWGFYAVAFPVRIAEISPPTQNKIHVVMLSPWDSQRTCWWPSTGSAETLMTKSAENNASRSAGPKCWPKNREEVLRVPCPILLPQGCGTSSGCFLTTPFGVCTSDRERKMRTKISLHKLFEHPQGSGTSRQNSWDVPDSSLRNPRKTNFRGRARSFRPPPLRVEDPHPTRRSPDPKS